MFEGMDFSKLELIYCGLRALIESRKGHGFHNGDMGHPAYRMGAVGEPDLGPQPADSAEQSVLFQLLSDASKEMKRIKVPDTGYSWWYDFSRWQDFCKFVVDIYDGKRDTYFTNRGVA